MSKVTIDRENCISCGTCYGDCPEFFEEGKDEGKSQVIAKYRIGGNPAEGEAPKELEEKVQIAADNCPASVIQVE